MNPLRYSQVIKAPRHIPGVNSSVPRNCRHLLRRAPPNCDGDTPPWDRVNPRIKAWVWDWLTPYQREGLAFAVSRPGANLWWAPGAGKTVGGILWALTGPHGWSNKIVVVTRAFTKGQWKREFEAVSNVRPVILDGQNPTTIDKDTEAVILNWEILPYWRKELTRWKGGDILAVIYDEIHRAKNWRRDEKVLKEDARGNVVPARVSLNNVSASAAALSHRANRRLGLTATPIRDRVSDLWSQLDIIEPGCWGSNWDFVHRYCAAKPGRHGGLDTSGKSNVNELKLRLKEVCHVVKYEEMARSLPPKRRQLCYLSPAEQSAPGAFATALKRAARNGASAIFEVKINEAASRKRQWIKEVVLGAVESGQKVTVFTGRRQEVESLVKTIEKSLDKLGAPLWWGHGGIDQEDRAKGVLAYSKYESGCCLVGTTEAYGEALDGLQHTDLVIQAQLPWTPGQVTQAEGRFSRQGQSRPVTIMYPIAEGTVDEHVADLLLDKLSAVGEVLDDASSEGLASTLSGEQNEEAIIAALLAKIEEE